MKEWRFQTDARGLSLCVCEWDGSGEVPVVILHGFLEQGASWHEVAAALGRRVLAPDQRGHGRSDHAGPGGFYHFWDYVSDVQALVDHLEGPVDLVGHSMGGTVACMFAALRPEAIRKLVLIEGLGPPDDRGRVLQRGRTFLDHHRSRPAHPTFATVEDAARRLQAAHQHLDATRALRLAKRVVRPVLEDDPDTRDHDYALTWAWDARHRWRSPTPFEADRFGQLLDAIQAPTLLVSGSDSVFVLPDADARAARIEHSRRIVVEGAGHMIHYDAPDRLAYAIADHLQD